MCASTRRRRLADVQASARRCRMRIRFPDRDRARPPSAAAAPYGRSVIRHRSCSDATARRAERTAQAWSSRPAAFAPVNHPQHIAAVTGALTRVALKMPTSTPARKMAQNLVVNEGLRQAGILIQQIGYLHSRIPRCFRATGIDAETAGVAFYLAGTRSCSVCGSWRRYLAFAMELRMSFPRDDQLAPSLPSNSAFGALI